MGQEGYSQQVQASSSVIRKISFDVFFTFSLLL